MECDDPFKLEKNIKTEFNKKFKLIAGNEYFEGIENNIKTNFIETIKKYENIKETNKSNNNQNETNKEFYIIKKKYMCDLCNKLFSSRQSLSEHKIKVFIIKQNNINNTINNIINNNELKMVKKEYKCKYCNKIYNIKQSKWAHEKVCKIKESNTTINKNSNNIAINSHNITNNTTNNTNNIKNTTNNIIINKFGTESVSKLSINEIKKLIKNDNYLIDIIKFLNFNENLPENHSFCNTSLEGKYISVLNTDTNKIEKISKNIFYNKVLNKMIKKLNELSCYIEFNNELNINIKYKKKLDDKMNYITENFYKNKINEKNCKSDINQLSYNNKKMIIETWNKLGEIINEILDSDIDSVSTLESENNLDIDSDSD